MAQVYISYSQNNAEAAKKIRDALEAWGHTIWLDDPDETFDRDLAEKLDTGLRESQIFIALLSPSSVKSRTVRREVAVAKSMNKSIIPVLVEPLTNISDSSGGKYIDATTNMQSAISRLTKAVNAKAATLAAKPPDDALDIEDDEEAEEDEGVRLFSPLALIMFAVLIVAIVIAVLSQTGSAPNNTNAVLTQVQGTADIQMTLAAEIRATADAQSTQINELAATQTSFAVEQQVTALALTNAAPSGTQESTGNGTATLTPTADLGVLPIDDEPTPTPETLDFSGAGGGLTIETGPTATIDLIRAQTGNLLTNPGFESFITLAGAQQLAQGWTPWFITGDDVPTYQLPPLYSAAGSAANRIRDGINAQAIYSSFSTHEGGLFQQVSGISPGAKVRFSVYAYVWSSTFSDIRTSEEAGDVTIEVGIDPTGGTDSSSADIVWSAPIERYDSYNHYEVSAVSTNSTITVFIRSKVGFPVANSYIYLDDALLFIE